MFCKYGFVYIWFDKKHKRFYIGCHWGTEDDGYVCSSTWMRNSYKRRPSDFRRRILSRVYTNRRDLLIKEYNWLSQIKDEELGKKYYNAYKHKFGHWSSEDAKRQWMSERNKGEGNPMFNKKGILSARYGIKHTEETKRKISARFLGSTTSRKGNELSESHKKALRVPKKNFEPKIGDLNHMHGGRWITNGKETIFLKRNQQLPTDFYYGRSKMENN